MGGDNCVAVQSKRDSCLIAYPFYISILSAVSQLINLFYRIAYYINHCVIHCHITESVSWIVYIVDHHESQASLLWFPRECHTSPEILHPLQAV